MKIFTTLFLASLFSSITFSQGTFKSNSSGNWNAVSTWTLISGTSTTNFPVTGDSAIILSGDTINVNVNSQCNQLNITAGSSLILPTSLVTLNVDVLNIKGGSFITIDQGILIVTGSLNASEASKIKLNQGALSVLGLAVLNAPLFSAGSTLLDVEGGIFTCVGGMTILPSVLAGQAEFRIGSNCVAIVAGGLVTFTNSSKINFTGNGTLTLSGLVNIPPSSFTAGKGQVLYLGIPGVDQAVAPLTYYRLGIIGLGNGLKTINGSVSVIDTLSLIADGLIINSGSLNLYNNATIVRTAGKLLSTPTFLGNVDVIYNNILKDTTGPEIPVSPTTLRNLVIDDISGIQLGSAVTVNSNVNLQLGALITAEYPFTISNPNGGASSDPAVDRTNGYVDGKIIRNIGTSTGIRRFPFGIDLLRYREFQLNYSSAPEVSGDLAVQYINSSPSEQSGLPLLDGNIKITNTAPFYWQADTLNGLVGGNYQLSLSAFGTVGVINVNSLRIIKRPSEGGAWRLNGTAGKNTGTFLSPVVVRTGMSGFSQFTIGSDNSNILPVNLLYFAGRLSLQNIVLSWATSSEDNTTSFEIERSDNENNFTTVGKVSAKGNSSTVTSYSFTDFDPVQKGNFYRLKQIDIDGKYSYSNVVFVSKSGTGQTVVYPNPCTDYIIIKTDNNEESYLYNSQGQFIRILLTGQNPVNDLSEGLYYIKNKEGVAKFVKK